jgi:hypothetical protein
MFMKGLPFATPAPGETVLTSTPRASRRAS